MSSKAPWNSSTKVVKGDKKRTPNRQQASSSPSPSLSSAGGPAVAATSVSVAQAASTALGHSPLKPLQAAHASGDAVPFMTEAGLAGASASTELMAAGAVAASAANPPAASAAAAAESTHGANSTGKRGKQPGPGSVAGPVSGPSPVQHAPQPTRRAASSQPSSGLTSGGAGTHSSASQRTSATCANADPQTDAVHEYVEIITSRNTNDRELRESLRRLRHLILSKGIPDTARENNGHGCNLRGRVWKALLSIYRVNALEYATLVQRGPCSVAEKIQNDTFRTLMTDKGFQSRVSNDMLLRVLNAFVWKAQDQPPSRLLNLRFSYVQGMNVLSAPFLYVLPELDAFNAFTSFIQQSCPLYVQPALEGVHCGLKLLDRCLEEIDPSLFAFLKAKQLTATVYAFPSVMTFSACTPPLDQALHLWDLFLAYGVHLNILCIVAQLLAMKTELMSSSSPMRMLRSFPELDARKIVSTTTALIPRLPEDLYDLLVRHTFDPIVCDMLLQEDAEN
ncbi:rab-GTPase-TBC domain-containing protein [Entophlyctis helioformis]|nr:rab-GTPase-TBC domain-containing protein [Entophlyctis helioformis]